jgi:hypothetical protein
VRVVSGLILGSANEPTSSAGAWTASPLHRSRASSRLCGQTVDDLVRCRPRRCSGGPRRAPGTRDAPRRRGQRCKETVRRQVACELAPKGVRVITIVTGGVPETLGAETDPSIEQGIVAATMIGRAATLEDVANVAVFAASDQARMMTAATLNISGGGVLD